MRVYVGGKKYHLWLCYFTVPTNEWGGLTEDYVVKKAQFSNALMTGPLFYLSTVTILKLLD